MYSLTLPGQGGEARSERAWAIGATVLVHLAILGGLLANAAREPGARAHEDGPLSLFTLVQLTAPHKTPAPAGAMASAPAAHAVPAGPSVHAAMPSAPALIEVTVPPRPASSTLAQLPSVEPLAVPAAAPAPAAVAAPAAAPARAAAIPGPAEAEDGPVVMVPLPGGEDGADGRKTIIIESMGSSVGSYLFPGLAGVTANNETRQFRVELGDYPDLQTAVVNDIIRRIRARFPDEIKWDSVVRGGIVTLSMRVEDHEALVRFLRAELFNPKRKTVIEAGNANALGPRLRLRN